jgi:hypothetical protein
MSNVKSMPDPITKIVTKFTQKIHNEIDCRGRIYNTSFSLLLVNGPNKLECYITLGWKGFPDTKPSSLSGSFISYEEN